MDKELELFAQAAEELEALKEQLQRQQSATGRLNAIAEPLEEVAQRISDLPDALQKVVDRAEATEARLEKAANEVKDLRDTIPRLIDQIEQSDYGRVATLLLAYVEELRHDIGELKAAAQSVNKAAETVSQAAQQAFESINVRFDSLDRVHVRLAHDMTANREEDRSRLDSLAAQVISHGEANARAYSQVTSTLKISAEANINMLQKLLASVDQLRNAELSALREQIQDVQTQVKRQASDIKLLSAKKGIFFS